ncbi:Cytochrome oxidase assembly protein 1 [Phytophthora cinnamomi]|uniref:Cytochrome oxidase assembly protein 1 n=1 Tax=Phytophthora cinnamomi TaxID=4785 RepID=UPI00355A13F4|nr:Cytochrome oxidase assembly protein 1 [Phytophthora cinnamomi]
MLLQLLRRAGAVPVARRGLTFDAHPMTAFDRRRAQPARFSSSRQGADKPLGLKDGAKTASGLSPTMQMLVAYVVVAMSAMGVVARFKSRDAKEDENVRIFNMAKRAVVKDRRVFETVGYPKDFERVTELNVDGTPVEPRSSEGSFRVKGDSGSVVVHYRQNLHAGEGDEEDKDSSIITFDELSVELADGSRFSALEAFLQNQDVVTHQKSKTLGNKMFFPVIGGVLIGGVASFFAIRILRNRPFYVHKLVLDHVNNHDLARQLLGHPIKSDRSKYVGVLTNEAANYTIACSGPKGNGTLIVKAFKKDNPDDTSDGKTEDTAATTGVMTTPGTSWKFSTLVLSVSRNEKRKAKNAKTINLLSGGDVPPVSSQRH